MINGYRLNDEESRVYQRLLNRLGEERIKMQHGNDNVVQTEMGINSIYILMRNQEILSESYL